MPAADKQLFPSLLILYAEFTFLPQGRLAAHKSRVRRDRGASEPGGEGEPEDEEEEDDVLFDGGFKIQAKVFNKLFDYQQTGRAEDWAEGRGARVVYGFFRVAVWSGLSCLLLVADEMTMHRL